ncbi:MAG: lipase family protein [Myxococcales bacterium]|nr:lipase family protein [Myxococcales bacterium]MCB9539692.1 lipase family protein [Myxococcales bacterium]
MKISLVLLALALPLAAHADFDSDFADITTATPYKSSYLLAGISDAAYGDSGQRQKRWRRMGLTQVAFEKKARVGAEVVIAKSDTYLIVSVRGTKNWKDFGTDAGAKKDSKRFKAVDARVHSGFAAHADALADFVARTVQAEKGSRKLYLTGHSLGGAVAALLAYDLQVNRGVQVDGVMTFGAPRVGGQGWASKYDRVLKTRTWRWINRHDPVPHVPSGNKWKHVGKRHIVRKRTIHFDAGSTPDADFASSDHKMLQYLRRLYNGMPAASRAGLPKPGELAI